MRAEATCLCRLPHVTVAPDPPCPYCRLKLADQAFISTVHAWGIREGGGLTVVPRRHVASLTELTDREFLGAMDLAFGLARSTSNTNPTIIAPIAARSGHTHATIRVEPQH